MALTDYTITETDYTGRDAASLPDAPSEAGMSAADLKAGFDRLTKEVVVPRHNGAVALLAGTGGAAAVGAADGGTVQAALDAKLAAAAVEQTLTPDADKVPSGKAVTDAMSAAGYGDMLKSVYDTDGDGVVDSAENAAAVGGVQPKKLLWSGSLDNGGSAVIEGIGGYTIFLCCVTGSSYPVLCVRYGTLFSGSSLYVFAPANNNQFYIHGSVSGSTLSITRIGWIIHTASGSHGAYNTWNTVSQIYGIL